MQARKIGLRWLTCNMQSFFSLHFYRDNFCFSGRHAEEFEWNIRKAPMNLVPLIWRNYSTESYVTGYVEDTGYSTFDYVKKGFTGQVLFVILYLCSD